MKVQKKVFSFLISLFMMSLVVMMPSITLAVPMMSLDAGGGNDLTITDGLANDATGAADGTILFNGSLGNFTILVSLGIDATSANVPAMSFSTTAVTGLNGGNLTAKFTTTDLTGPLPSAAVGLFNSNIFGATMGNVTYQAYLDSGNNAFAFDSVTNALATTATPLTSFAGPFSGMFNDNDSTAAPALAGPYSLTMVFEITQSPMQITSTTATLQGAAGPPNGQPVIPEPSTVLLFGTGLVGVGLWRWKKTKSEKAS